MHGGSCRRPPMAPTAPSASPGDPPVPAMRARARSRVCVLVLLCSCSCCARACVRVHVRVSGCVRACVSARVFMCMSHAKRTAACSTPGARYHKRDIAPRGAFMQTAFACVCVHMRAGTYHREDACAFLRRRRRKTPCRRQSSRDLRPSASVRVRFFRTPLFWALTSHVKILCLWSRDVACFLPQLPGDVADVARHTGPRWPRVCHCSQKQK